MASSSDPPKGNVSRHRLLRLKIGMRTILLGPGTITIGRRRTCDIMLDGPQTSREHARVIVGDQSAAIQDLGSGNGVIVNGRRIQGLQRLNAGDRVQIGVHVIEVLSYGESKATDPEEPEATMIGVQHSIPADWADDSVTHVRNSDKK